MLSFTLLLGLAWASPELPAVDVASLPASAVVRPADVGGTRHPVEARLLVEPGVAVAGSTVRVGVHLQQDEGWHTYWRAPGETGKPTELTWTLPAGVEVAARHWPLPERFEATEIVSYGYDHEVLHIVELTLPADQPAGALPITVDVTWLACKGACIPGEARLATSLVVGSSSVMGPNAPVFAAWAERWPTQPAELKAEVLVCAQPIVPGTPWRTVVDVVAAEGVAITVPSNTRDGAVVPVFGPDAGVDAVQIVPTAQGFALQIDATPYAVPASAEGRLIGALLQLEVEQGGDRRVVRTEVLSDAVWQESGTPVVSGDPRCADAVVVAAAPDAEAPEPEVAAVAAWSFGLLAWNLVMALIGGLVLNVMPCVLPVLTLKVYGLVEQGASDARERRRAGLAYTLGILASFWALAFGVWALRFALGETVGWGFQMQYPPYVAAVATVVFLFGLSMFGVFEIPVFGADKAHELSTKEGAHGHFFNGVFATLVATPCSAPFLSTATAFAFSAPTPVLVLVFTFVGLGLALPFLLVAYVPAAYKLLPAPGAWMETFKHILGFTLLATAVWLSGVLFAQIGLERATGFLAFLASASFAAWIFGHFAGVAATTRRQALALLASSLTLAAGWWMFLDLEFAAPETCDDGEVSTELSFDDGVPWQRFSESRLDALAGRLVFVDFTADWCVSCKVNERTVLETQAVRDAMKHLGVVPLQGDWTRKDPVISRWLAKHGRAGVPLYLVVPADGAAHAVALPEVITPGMVVSALETAAKGGLK